MWGVIVMCVNGFGFRVGILFLVVRVDNCSVIFYFVFVGLLGYYFKDGWEGFYDFVLGVRVDFRL